VTTPVDTELGAMNELADAFDALDQPACERVLNWAWDRYVEGQAAECRVSVEVPEDPSADRTRSIALNTHVSRVESTTEEVTLTCRTVGILTGAPSVLVLQADALARDYQPGELLEITIGRVGAQS